ncbi:MAG: flippase-like domain-containing protein [Candidatus Micrarchaeota archaeon]
MQKTFKYLLIAVIAGFAISFAVMLGVGLENIWQVLKQTNYLYMGIALGFTMLSVIATNLRWRVVVNDAGIKISGLKLFLISLSGIAFSNLTPSARFGGEPIRAYFINKHAKVHTRSSLATIVTEKVFDAAIFCLISIIAIGIAVKQMAVPVWALGLVFLSLLMILSLMILAIYISIKPDAGRRMMRWFLRKFSFAVKSEKTKDKILRDMVEYSENMAKLLRRKSLWLKGALFSLLIWLCDVARIYFIFLALGFAVDPSTILVVLIISLLAGTLPLLPGGLGIMEPVMIIIYNSSGITLVAAGMATIIDRLFSFWLLTILGLGATSYLGLKLGKGADIDGGNGKGKNKGLEGRKMRCD